MSQGRSARVTSSATAKVAAPREQDLHQTTASGLTLNAKPLNLNPKLLIP